MFITNWKRIAAGAWSMWAFYLLGIIAALPEIIDLVAPDHQIAPQTHALILLVATFAGGLSRLIDQPWLRGFIKDESGAMRKRSAGAIAGSAGALAVAVNMIGGFEGLRTEAYRDVVGVWTVCYGETRGVQPGDSHSIAACDAMLAREIVNFEAQLDHCLTAPVPIEAKIAFVSWAYNVGTGAACRSTLVRKANAGDIEGACKELPRWNRAGGRVWRGLTNRRLSERALCLSGLA